MKRFVYGIFFMVVAVTLSACGKTSVDLSVSEGKLENGFSYYIKENSYPKGKALLRLIVKAGSLHEEDEQRGLAHFVEHMVFRGSENFEDWEVIDFLESIGAKFGPDTNAYTMFDHTCYMLEIPLSKEETLEKSILILSDWAARAKMTDELIEKERRVIFDEMNGSTKNCSWRQITHNLGKLFKGSRLIDRFPIGLEDVVLNCNPQLIRDFYQKWYRPDRMALVAVGDFDAKKVESYVKQCFSDIENSAALDDSSYAPGIKRLKDRKIVIFSDPELPINTITGERFYKVRSTKKPNTKSVHLIKEFAVEALNRRLERLSKTANPPFISASAEAGHSVGFAGLFADSYFILPYEDRPYEGLTAFNRELESMGQYGLTESEFVQIKKQRKAAISHKLRNLDKVSHEEFVTRIQNYIMNNTRSPNLEKGLKRRRKSLEKLSLEEVNLWLKENVTSDAFHVVASGNKEGLFSKKAVCDALAEAKAAKLEKQEESSRPELVLKDSETEPYKVDVVKGGQGKPQKFLIENGLKVVVCRSERKKDQIFMDIVFSPKGWVFNESESASLLFAEGLLQEGGVANLDHNEFADFLSDKMISYRSSMAPYHVSFTLLGKQRKMEELFKLARALFTERRYDEEVWNNLYNSREEIEKNLTNFPEIYFSQRVSEAITAGHPLTRMYKAEEGSFKEAIRCCEKIFSDLSYFTLYIAGDFDEGQLEEFVGRYFATITPSNERLTVEPFPEEVLVKENLQEDIRRGKETHSRLQALYTFSLSGKLSKEELSNLRAFSHLLNRRLLNKLRREFGETYGTVLYTTIPFSPHQTTEGVISVSFSSQPEKQDALLEEVEKQMQAFLEESITDEELATVKEIFKAEESKNLQSNSGFLAALEWCDLHKVDLEMRLNSDAWVDATITKERIEKLGKLFLSQKSRLLFTLGKEAE